MLINPVTLPPASAVGDAGKDGMDLNAIKIARTAKMAFVM